MNAGAPKMVCIDYSKDCYEVLGVSKNASQDDLKKAYREASMKHHPDKGGDPEKFKELARAYGALRDPEKREIYHRCRRDYVRSLKVSLEDLYNGASKKQRFSRLQICSKCNGKGSKSGASIMICSGCGGSGTKPYPGHYIPGMHYPCHKCMSTGETLHEAIPDEDRCEQCKGEKTVMVKPVLEVHVKKGMQHGDKITFTREEFPTSKGRGVVFILEQKEHPKFKRKGDDLFVEHTLSDKEAMCGFQFRLTHLDGRQLIVKSQPGEEVKPGDFKAINDEGMPMYQSPSMRGKLYIHFSVEYSLPPLDQSSAIEAVLPLRSSPQLTADMEVDGGEETTLHDVNQQQALTAYNDMYMEMMRMRYPNEGAMRKRRVTFNAALIGTKILVCRGLFKGSEGRVVKINDRDVWIEMGPLRRVFRVNRKQISDSIVSTPFCQTFRYDTISVAAPRRTPLHPYMTPMRDSGTTPIPDNMPAWNPDGPMSPPRDDWEDGHWGTSLQYEPESPPSRPYEAPTLGSGWTSTPGGSYSDAGIPKDSGSAYGGDGEGPGLIPDILVNIGVDSAVGVIREVLPDGACKIGIGGDMIITAHPDEIEIVVPKKSDKIKIMGGTYRGSTGTLIGVDGTDGFVRLGDDTLDIKMLDMAILAKLAQS